MICSAWQVCEPPDQAVRLEFEVAEGATVADAKRLVSIARPKWRVQAQMVGARLSGALGDGARLADHGGAGIVEFPNGPYLHASDLNAALKAMNGKKMYDKLVFYMEACNGGSMFANLLPTDINVYATTAANADESSWGTLP